MLAYGCYTKNSKNGWNVPSVVMQQSERSIPKDIAEEAYKEYAAQGHGSQSFDRICERGGFSAEEISLLLFDRISRILKESPDAGH